MRILKLLFVGVLLYGFVLLFILTLPVHAATYAFPGTGGTGTSTAPGLNSVLIGSAAGVYDVKTLTQGSGVTITNSGSTLTISASAAASSFPFTPTAWGNATSTTLGFLNGFLSTASSTINSNFFLPNLSQGLGYIGTNGLVQGGVATGTVSAGSSAITVTGGRSVIGGTLSIDCAGASASQNGCLSSTDWSTFNNKQATISATWPIILTGATLSFGGLSTSTAAVIGNIPVFSGVNTFYNIATSTPTISSGLSYSGTIGNLVGGTSGSLTCATGSATVFGCLSAANFNIFNNKVGTSSNATAGQVAYFTTTSGTPALLSGVATGTISNGNGISVTAGQSVIGSGLTITNTGLISATCTGGTTCSGTNPITINSYSWPWTPGTEFGTSTNATSTVMSFKMGLFASSTSRIDTLLLGSTTPQSFTNAPLVITGNVNSYTQTVLQNLNSGTTASADLIFGTDLMTNTKYYGDLGYNSSGNTDSNYTAFGANALYLYNTDADVDLATASTTNQTAALRFSTGGTLSANERARIDFAGRLGLGTTTPVWLSTFASSTAPQLTLSDALGSTLVTLRSIGGNLLLATSTYTATSSLSSMIVTAAGQLSLLEYQPGTSTAMTVDWNTTPNQVVLQLGTSAVTIGFNNASTSGMTKRILLCNAGAAASTVTWSVNSSATALLWPAATAPTQTTTANKCDIYSFIVSQATSTSKTTVKIFGAATQNF